MADFIAVMTMFVGYLQPKQQGRLVLLAGAQLILLGRWSRRHA
jgi:putative copper resistance protein D